MLNPMCGFISSEDCQPNFWPSTCLRGLQGRLKLTNIYLKYLCVIYDYLPITCKFILDDIWCILWNISCLSFTAFLAHFNAQLYSCISPRRIRVSLCILRYLSFQLQFITYDYYCRHPYSHLVSQPLLMSCVAFVIFKVTMPHTYSWLGCWMYLHGLNWCIKFWVTCEWQNMSLQSFFQ